ncbi:MAG: adenine deaminase [Desulfobacterales bacterium]|nr:MAG: adenine deaminase [Desulfobacterales bacterium]
MNLAKIIKAAHGEEPVDLLLTNARIVNVFSGEIQTGSIAISGGCIAGFGDYPAKKITDVNGRFVAPGFIDAHVHIESSMTCITEFARAVLIHGTTTVAADPHEIANVLGTQGIDYMLQSAEDQPMNIFFTLPSCVPATDLETSGAKLAAEDLEPYMRNDRIIALAEMMNFPGVISSDPDILSKLKIAKQYRKPIDGHAPGLQDKDLYAYISAGISSDHECTTAREAKNKLMAGMHIMIRQGTGARNLKQLLPIVNENTARRAMWCTDDRHPHDLLEQGHIDAIVGEAIAEGLDPLTAIQMATINPAEYFGLRHLGAVAPGRQADMVVFADMHSPQIEQVYYRGVLVAKDGEMIPDIKKPAPISIPPSMNVNIEAIDFSLRAEGKHIRVIDIVPDQLITRQVIERVTRHDGMAVSDPSRDLLKIAVVERHSGAGKIGKAFVKGLGLRAGALASSVAHDSHNIIVVGTNDEDMKAASKAVVNMGGGLAIVSNQDTLARLPLPVAGLMSLEPVKYVHQQMNELVRISLELGSSLKDPFMTLSFLALPVIPELKLTDLGLIDVNQFKVVPLFVDS